MTKRKEIIKVTYRSDAVIHLLGYNFDEEDKNEGRSRRVSPSDLISAMQALNDYKSFEEGTEGDRRHDSYLVNGVVVLRQTERHVDRECLGSKISLAYTSIRRLNDVASKLGLPVTQEEYLTRRDQAEAKK